MAAGQGRSMTESYALRCARCGGRMVRGSDIAGVFDSCLMCGSTWDHDRLDTRAAQAEAEADARHRAVMPAGSPALTRMHLAGRRAPAVHRGRMATGTRT